MKLEVIVPEPVESSVVLTMTESEAALLKKLLGQVRGNSKVLTALRGALATEVNVYKAKGSVRYNTAGYLIADDMEDGEW